eukprot:CAMPEP_0175078818 /NCGR_PEP_ID=MMETSP0052_2-20121109/24398_1 /TAXON_ID=51329 ORGANISM="Polytomella parva, Strain SAG 63-3" /NCGR_SAMPLE_ID=MMETSP0052_2 /ASSEMBLY_ACC=CAM_ASM_000194 /LENGTH=126 /DNA_ID=CAMNT_0016348919 /DNA_START=9 /DNA_END=386 /DNA_ORIENTATION=+
MIKEEGNQKGKTIAPNKMNHHENNDDSSNSSSLANSSSSSLASLASKPLPWYADVESWIAKDEEEYIAKGVVAAADIQGLAKIRREMRQAMAASPLCDCPGAVRRLEDVYRRLWRRHVRREEADAW